MSVRYNLKSKQLLERVPRPIPGTAATHQWLVFKTQRGMYLFRDHKLEKDSTLITGGVFRI